MGITGKNRFVITIGDEGAILTFFKGTRLAERLFATPDYPAGKEAFVKLLKTSPNTPLYFMLDVIDQANIQHSLPAVSSLSINKLVKKRLERDFSPDDVKGALPIGREKSGRKDWQFMFVSAHLSPPFSVWLEFCMEQPNPIAGIYMLPVEAETFQKQLNLALGLKEKSKAGPEWQFLVLHNRVSGFRQVVFHHGRMVFSRLVHGAVQELAGVTAGNIEQEVLNSLEYLRRLSLPEHTKMDIFICTSEDIKRGFEIKEIHGNRLVLLTPYELAQKWGLTKAVQPKDQYADVVFAASFIQHRPVMRLHSAVTRHLQALHWLRMGAKYLALAAIPIALLTMSIRFWEIWDLQQTMAVTEAKKIQAERKWEEVQASAKVYDEQSTVMRDMVTLYKLLSGNNHSPLTLLSMFNSIKGDNVIVRNINWKLLESGTRGSAMGHTTINMNLSVDIYNEGDSLDQLFAGFDQFVKRMDARFSDYSVEYSQLPEKITVGQVSRVVPVEIRIIGPRQ